MFHFELKTYRPEMSCKEHSFFILNRGMNSGRPMNQPCPNCFVCYCDNAAEKQKLFWLLFALWEGKQIQSLLIGSVIPFVRIRDLEKVMKEKANQQTMLMIEKSMPMLQDFHRKEKAFNEMSKKIRVLKIQYLRSLVN